MLPLKKFSFSETLSTLVLFGGVTSSANIAGSGEGRFFEEDETRRIMEDEGTSLEPCGREGNIPDPMLPNSRISFKTRRVRLVAKSTNGGNTETAPIC